MQTTHQEAALPSSVDQDARLDGTTLHKVPGMISRDGILSGTTLPSGADVALRTSVARRKTNTHRHEKNFHHSCTISNTLIACAQHVNYSSRLEHFAVQHWSSGRRKTVREEDVEAAADEPLLGRNPECVVCSELPQRLLYGLCSSIGHVSASCKCSAVGSSKRRRS